jgi:hypothetical protein
MAKRVDFDAIDEKSVIDYVRNNRTVVPAGKPEEVAPNPVPTGEKPEQPETETVPVSSEPPKTSEAPKEEVRRKPDGNYLFSIFTSINYSFILVRQ